MVILMTHTWFQKIALKDSGDKGLNHINTQQNLFNLNKDGFNNDYLEKNTLYINILPKKKLSGY